jgi:hypothetical protein
MKLAIWFGIFLFVICAIGPIISVIVSVHVVQKKSKENNIKGE